MSMESARACTDAAALRRFAWRDYLSRGLVDAITCRASNKNKFCMPPRCRVRSSERDAMCRPPSTRLIELPALHRRASPHIEVKTYPDHAAMSMYRCIHAATRGLKVMNALSLCLCVPMRPVSFVRRCGFAPAKLSISSGL